MIRLHFRFTKHRLSVDEVSSFWQYRKGWGGALEVEMRNLILIVGSLGLTACSSWGALNSDDMLREARERSAQTSQAKAHVHWQEETFGPLAGFVGKTFRGEPITAEKEPNPDGVADIQSWTWSDDGKEIIIRHALEDGSYGGVTNVYPDGEDDELAYRYVTGGGFETLGKFTFDEDGSWEAIEVVDGHETITHVRSRGYQRADGALISEADYLTADGWQRGHSFVYTNFVGDVPETILARE